MNERLRKVAKWVGYPLFYLFCLGLFGYLTFPFDRLKDRLIAEFQHAQTKRGQASGQRLEIDHLSSYWFTGLEAEGVRLILPPDDGTSSSGRSSSFEAALKGAGSSGATEPPKETVVTIDEVHGRLQVLPLLIGRVKIKFWASAFGGEVMGTVPVGAASGPVEVELADIDLGKIEPLVTLIGLPLKGTAAGRLELAAGEGKFNKANGSLEVKMSGVALGDGKTKFKGQIALPEAKLGDVTITAEATSGVLKITTLSAGGPDVELEGDGKVSVREPWNDSTADLYLRFKFSDAYRDKNDDTRSLLGSPNSTMPALIEIVEPKIKRAKRSDGFYGFHVIGPLKKVKFEPSAVDSPGSKAPRSKTSDSPFAAPKKPGGVQFPLGTSQVTPKEEPSPPLPAPTPAPEPAAEPVRPSEPTEPSPAPPAPTPAPAPQERESER